MTGPLVVPPPPVYASDQEFFDLFLGQLFARNKRFKWCLQWQEHEEAAFVIKVLHDTYEVTVAAGSGEIGVWLRDYAYTLFFDRLCAPDGTFAECNGQSTSPSHELPLPLRSA